MVVETEKSHSLPSSSWRTKKAEVQFSLSVEVQKWGGAKGGEVIMA